MVTLRTTSFMLAFVIPCVGNHQNHEDSICTKRTWIADDGGRYLDDVFRFVSRLLFEFPNSRLLRSLPFVD